MKFTMCPWCAWHDRMPLESSHSMRQWGHHTCGVEAKPSLSSLSRLHGRSQLSKKCSVKESVAKARHWQAAVRGSSGLYGSANFTLSLLSTGSLKLTAVARDVAAMLRFVLALAVSASW
jgi:hypothetical protein